MKKRYLTGLYQSRITLLHRVPPGFKLGLVVLYIGVLLAISHLAALLLLLLLLEFGAWRLKLVAGGYRMPALVAIASLMLILASSDASWLTAAAKFLTLFIRVLVMNRLVRWYGQATSPEIMLDWLQRRSKARLLQEWALFISMMLALYPGIQRDLERTIESEHLRLGRRPGWWMPGVWFGILMHTLVRTVNRAHHLGENLVERGYTPGTTFTPLLDKGEWRSIGGLLPLWLLPGLLALFVDGRLP